MNWTASTPSRALRASTRALVGCIALASYALAGCGDDTEVKLFALDATANGDDGGCPPYPAVGPDSGLAAQGLTLIEHLGCQKCHGDGLSGNQDGVQSPTTVGGLAYPPNLTSDVATGLGCWTNDQIENALLLGIDNQGMPLCPPMPHFAEAGVDVPSAEAIVAYLRSLAPVQEQVPNTLDCLQTGQGAGDDASGD